MKKRDFAALALLGISAGLVIGGCQQQGNNRKAYANEQMSPDMQAFYNSLSSQAQRHFMQLDAQHRMMAVQMANQRCHGMNECKGMGGCETSQNKCAGYNECKGQGGAPVQHANEAVNVQHHHMQQRQQMQNNMNGNGRSMRNGNGNRGSCGGPGGCGGKQSNNNSIPMLSSGMQGSSQGYDHSTHQEDGSSSDYYSSQTQSGEGYHEHAHVHHCHNPRHTHRGESMLSWLKSKMYR